MLPDSVIYVDGEGLETSDLFILGSGQYKIKVRIFKYHEPFENSQQSMISHDKFPVS